MSDYDCQTCGLCCLTAAVPPGFTGCASGSGREHLYSDYPQYVQLPAEVKGAMESAVAEGNPVGPCIMFDTETYLCKYPDLRPETCVAFEVGGVVCRRLRGEE